MATLTNQGVLKELLTRQCPIKSYLATLTNEELKGHTREFDSFAYIAQVSKELASNDNLAWTTDDEDIESGKDKNGSHD